MKKLLLLFPLLSMLLVGCGFSRKTYTNVYFYYSYDDKVYKVITQDEKKFNVNVENYHQVIVDELRRETHKCGNSTCYDDYIVNEFFTSNKTLYVYTLR